MYTVEPHSTVSVSPCHTRLFDEPEAVVGGLVQAPRRAVEHAVSQVFGIGQDDLRKTTRGRAPVARARQVAMYLTHVGFGLTLTQVGQLFERDRTTAAHACSVIEDCRDDPSFDRTLELLEWASRALVNGRIYEAAGVDDVVR